MIEKLLKEVGGSLTPTATAGDTDSEKMMRLIGEQQRGMGQFEKISPQEIEAMAAQYAGGSPAPAPQLYNTVSQESSPGYSSQISPAPPQLPGNVKNPQMRTQVNSAVQASTAPSYMGDDEVEDGVRYALQGSEEDMPALEAAAVADFVTRKKSKKR